MINTSAFESLERTMRLKKALDFLNASYTFAEGYDWMTMHVEQALERELRFAEVNASRWEKEETSRDEE